MQQWSKYVEVRKGMKKLKRLIVPKKDKEYVIKSLVGRNVEIVVREE